MFNNHETLQYIQTLTILLLYFGSGPDYGIASFPVATSLPPLSLLWTLTSHLYNCLPMNMELMLCCLTLSLNIYQLIYLLLASLLLLNACWLAFLLLAGHFAFSLIYITIYNSLFIFQHVHWSWNPSIYPNPHHLTTTNPYHLAITNPHHLATTNPYLFHYYEPLPSFYCEPWTLSLLQTLTSLTIMNPHLSHYYNLSLI